jgi:hypothetical protein
MTPVSACAPGARTGWPPTRASTSGANYAAPLSDACDPGMLVAWHTLADDGEFHGWHVGTLKEWDNGTAIVRTADGREKAVQG